MNKCRECNALYSFKCDECLNKELKKLDKKLDLIFGDKSYSLTNNVIELNKNIKNKICTFCLKNQDILNFFVIDIKLQTTDLICINCKNSMFKNNNKQLEPWQIKINSIMKW